jgi:hypothetical protein
VIGEGEVHGRDGQNVSTGWWEKLKIQEFKNRREGLAQRPLRTAEFARVPPNSDFTTEDTESTELENRLES